MKGFDELCTRQLKFINVCKRKQWLYLVSLICFLFVISLHSPRCHRKKDVYIQNSSIAYQRKHLLNLNRLQWPKQEFASIPTGINRSLPPLFNPKMSHGQRATIDALFVNFIDIMERLKLSDKWMLYGGTLLGSFRHHDYIPWDDDFDILISASFREIIRAEYKLMEPKYFMLPAGNRDKVFAKLIPPMTFNDAEGSRRTNQFQWGWPFLDLTYYTENKTHIQEVATSYGRTYSFLKTDIFPLILRPLGLAWAPVPRNTLAFLIQSYPNGFDCVSPSYSHVIENGVPSKTLPCIELAQRYAFVRRRPFEGCKLLSEPLDWVVETLSVLDADNKWKEIHRLYVLAPRHEATLKTFQVS